MTAKEYNFCIAKAKEDINKRLDERKEFFERALKKVDTLNVGDIVYYKTHHQSDKFAHCAKQLAPLYEGSMVVVKCGGVGEKNCSYTLQHQETGDVVKQHINNLKYK